MQLHATHRRDGTAVVQADVEVTPFLGFIEIPQAGHEEVTTGSAATYPPTC